MITLFVLLGAFAVFAVISRIGGGAWKFRTPAGYAMAILLAFTGISHFFLTEGMVRMIPEFVPYRLQLIYLSGIAELLLAGAMVFPPRAVLGDKARPIVGIAAMLFLASLTPANVYAAIQAVDFGGHGAGPIYLLFRIPLQILFLVWIYLAFVRGDLKGFRDPVMV